jgi:hypothetical protein
MSTTLRSLALASGAVTLIAIGVLVVSMTPQPSGGEATRSTSPTVASALLSAPRATPAAAVEPGTSLAAVTTVASTVAAPAPAVPPVVTPIGDGFSGVATAAAVRRSLDAAQRPDGAIDAVLHSGALVVAHLGDPADDVDVDEFVDELDDVVVVELTEWAQGAMQVAARRPDADDVVVVLTDPPVEVELARVHEVGAADGTPVVDTDGQLVGLCADDGDGRRVVLVAPTPPDD